jgi:hypothetical protein
MRLLLAILAAASLSTTPAEFAPANGWYVGAGTLQTCPGVPAARCSQRWFWTATVPWKDCPFCLPHRTVGTLPRNGIAISASIVIERPIAAKREVAWPPRIRATDVGARFEGLPRRIGVYQLFARVGKGREIYLVVFFGRADPTPRQIGKANARLASVRLH